MRRPPNPAVRAYVAAVIAGGAALVVGLVEAGALGAARSAPPAFWVLGAMALAGQLVPIHIPRSGEPESITTSEMFVFAQAFIAGVAPAVAWYAVVAAAAFAVRRSPGWKTAFNGAQYALSFAAGGAVFAAVAGAPLGGPAGELRAPDLVAILGGALVFFAVNNVLSGVGMALAQGSPPVPVIMADISLHAGTTLALASLSVAVVALVDRSLWFAAVVAVPLVIVHQSARIWVRSAQDEARFRALVQGSADAIAVLDADAQVRYASRSAERVNGCAPDDLIGRPILDLVHPDDAIAFRTALAEVTRDPPRVRSIEPRLRHADGSWRWTEISVTNMLAEPSIRGIVLNYRDVSARRELQEQLAHQAFHDPLTGFANRALLEDRLAHAQARARRGGGSLALVLLDLDSFKTVNDSLGHAAGDRLLVAVAERIQACLRPGDTGARLGGDEFAILLEDVASAGDAGRVAARILEALARPFALGDREVFVRASLGIAAGSASGGRVEDLLRDADVAMYAAKSAGGGRVVTFEPRMHALALERLNLEGDLRRAVEREGFSLAYQPIVDLGTGRIVSAEALIRWNDPARGAVAPAEFIPIAEDTGAIVPIGRWVLREVCSQLRDWRERLPEAADLTASINLSARQLREPEVVDEVFRALATADLRARDLSLEITESSVIDADDVIERLRALRDGGVRLAIDDFGTGYSSLSYLQNLPVEIMKIDRAFVARLAGGPEESALAHAIVRIGHSLGLRVVAEGIETAGQLDRLRALGCDLGQGYLIARPLAPEAFERMLRAAPSLPAWEKPSDRATGPSRARSTRGREDPEGRHASLRARTTSGARLTVAKLSPTFPAPGPSTNCDQTR